MRVQGSPSVNPAPADALVVQSPLPGESETARTFADVLWEIASGVSGP